MQRWNGWGEASVTMTIPPRGLEILVNQIGRGRPVSNYPLEKLLDRVPPSRMPQHPLAA
jgi:alkyldihydroxyacetonephosphate synthase